MTGKFKLSLLAGAFVCLTFGFGGEEVLLLSRSTILQLQQAAKNLSLTTQDLNKVWKLEKKSRNQESVQISPDELPELGGAAESLVLGMLRSSDSNSQRAAMHILKAQNTLSAETSIAAQNYFEKSLLERDKELAQEALKFKSDKSGGLERWALRKIGTANTPEQKMFFEHLITGSGSGSLEGLRYALSNNLENIGRFPRLPELASELSPTEQASLVSSLVKQGGIRQFPSSLLPILKKDGQSLVSQVSSGETWPIKLPEVKAIIESDAELKQKVLHEIRGRILSNDGRAYISDPQIIQFIGSKDLRDWAKASREKYKKQSGISWNDYLKILEEAGATDTEIEAHWKARESKAPKMELLLTDKFPQFLRNQYFEEIANGVEPIDAVFPVYQDGSDFKLSLTPEQKKHLLPYRGILRRKINEEWKRIDSLLTTQKAAFLTIASELSGLTPEQKTEAIQKIDGIDKDLSHWEMDAFLPALARVFQPDDKELAKSLFSKSFPDRESLRGNTELAERFRENLNPELQKSFDSYISALITPGTIEKSACKVLCAVRENEQWRSPKFLNENELEGAASESVFGTKTVVALFDLKSRGLCQSSRQTDTSLAQFHHPALPPALSGKTEAETHAEQTNKSRSQLENLQSAHDLATGALDLLHSNRLVTPDTADRWKGIFNEQLDAFVKKDSARMHSSPAVLSTSLLYGIMIGKLAEKQVPPNEKKEWAAWKSKVDSGYSNATKDFTKKVAGVGGSHFGNYAIALTALAESPPPKEVIDDMENTAAGANFKCRIPYERSEGRQTGDEAIYRSSTFYYALYKATKKPIYREALVNCLEEYVGDPWGRVHGSTRRLAGGIHEGPRGFAPYYFYATLFLATQAAQDLARESTSEVEVRRMNLILEGLTGQALAEYDPKSRTFTMNSSGVFRNLPAYFNPLLALALVPACELEQKAAKHPPEGTGLASPN